MAKNRQFHKDRNMAVFRGKDFKLSRFDTGYTANFTDERSAEKQLKAGVERLSGLQEKLYASDRHSVLIIFQAMDAAGKDSTIEHVLKGINPQGCHVVSFKKPTEKELSHDFLWRTTLELPERGRIGIFNRSYYEEVLVTKVHPEYILGQDLPGIRTPGQINKSFWEKRYRSIRNYEKHLADNGYLILKFFLNVSPEVQKNRFIERVNNPEKNWKFQLNDLKEREHWDAYMRAFEKMIRETAARHAPWYVIPADNKWFMQMAVCDIILGHLDALKLKFPKLTGTGLAELEEARGILKR